MSIQKGFEQAVTEILSSPSSQTQQALKRIRNEVADEEAEACARLAVQYARFYENRQDAHTRNACLDFAKAIRQRIKARQAQEGTV